MSAQAHTCCVFAYLSAPDGLGYQIFPNVDNGLAMRSLAPPNGRPEATFIDRASFDEWHVRNWSVWLDIMIPFKTVRVVLMCDGAH